MNKEELNKFTLDHYSQKDLRDLCVATASAKPNNSTPTSPNQPEPNHMINIYVASHVKNAEAIQRMRTELWSRKLNAPLNINSRWIDVCAAGKLTDCSGHAKKFWTQDFEDIENAQWLVIWSPDTKKPLRGALVEAGYALAKGLSVIVVGSHDSFGTWQFHPSVHPVPTWEEAVQLIEFTHKL